jgi:hypothetical protein
MSKLRRTPVLCLLLLGGCTRSLGDDTPAQPPPTAQGALFCDGTMSPFRATSTPATMEMGHRFVGIPARLTTTAKVDMATLEYRRSVGATVRCRYSGASGSPLALLGCDGELDPAATMLATDSLVLNVEPANAKTGFSFDTCMRDMPVRPAGFGELPPGIFVNGAGEHQVPTEGETPAVSTPLPFSFDAARIEEFRRAAEADVGVKKLLGPHFTYIRLDQAELPKGQELAEAYEADVTFFNYTALKAVKVRMKNGAVVDADFSDEWPNEGKEEIAEAVRIARRAPQLAGKIADLEAGAMVAVPVTGNEAWIGRRVLDVKFFTPVTTVTHYYALVDMSSKTVIFAGSDEERP